MFVIKKISIIFKKNIRCLLSKDTENEVSKLNIFDKLCSKFIEY